MPLALASTVLHIHTPLPSSDICIHKHLKLARGEETSSYVKSPATIESSQKGSFPSNSTCPSRSTNSSSYRFHSTEVISV